MPERFTIEDRRPAAHPDEDLRADVLAGLTVQPKSLPPKWFYDARGSRLFSRITRLPEYYLTRAETEILAARAPWIAADTAARTLVELGSGDSEKTRLLIDALDDSGTLERYAPIDVDPTVLEKAGTALRRGHPWLDIHAIADDFRHDLRLEELVGPRLVVFLGSTVGNLLPAERVQLLARIGDSLGPGDALLLGTDLVKDPGALTAAYDDAAGVTAAFNKNLLSVLNRRLGADFNPGDFTHVAVWDPVRERIEMRLRAQRALTVKIPAIGLAVDFDEGEDLLTETSAKFRRESVHRELEQSGMALRHWWTDAEGRYALSLAEKRS